MGKTLLSLFDITFDVLLKAMFILVALVVIASASFVVLFVSTALSRIFN